MKIAEDASAVLEEIGDHLKGVQILERFLGSLPEVGGLPARDLVRLRRRLGVHHHRSGAVDKALEIFDEIHRTAKARRDREDLILVDSELAELHIFRSSYDAAAEACDRALARVEELDAGDAFRSRIEFVLRASRGHLELRRLNLEPARTELRAAWALARQFGTTAEQAANLNNLGIAENQLNRLEPARRAFQRAETLLTRAGEHGNVIKICTNLAVIAAKAGDPDEAQVRIERAARLVEQYPEPRVEFFTHYARGIVQHLLGDSRAAIPSLGTAIERGRQLGDDHLVSFGRVYLAEAYLAVGRYQDTDTILHGVERESGGKASALVQRLVHSRLLFVETLLGRRRPISRSRHVLERMSRTDFSLLEAWNDFFVGMALLENPETARARLTAAQRVFSKVGIPYGERFTRVGLVALALSCGDRDAARQELGHLSREVDTGHRFLAVAEPLVRAQAFFHFGELTEAQEAIEEASRAIVGLPFLELDWQIEALRGRIALRRDDRQEARRHLHRCAHTRDLLLKLIPRGAADRFLAQPRWTVVAELASQLQRSPSLHVSTKALRRSPVYEGMVGQSSVMVEMFKAIEALHDHELPVLILGETGTGKELVARAVHQRSPRRRAPFVALHCASLAPELFESELFGFEAGAFSGAESARGGIVESVDGGTLLLDDIIQLHPEAQAKLLRFLDTGRYRRLGSAEVSSVNVRVLSASTPELATAVERGEFRRDLYYRLRGVEVSVPPLRARRRDWAWSQCLALGTKHHAQLLRN